MPHCNGVEFRCVSINLEHLSWEALLCPKHSHALGRLLLWRLFQDSLYLLSPTSFQTAQGSLIEVKLRRNKIQHNQPNLDKLSRVHTYTKLVFI